LHLTGLVTVPEINRYPFGSRSVCKHASFLPKKLTLQTKPV
jgi:hypothetical protein